MQTQDVQEAGGAGSTDEPTRARSRVVELASGVAVALVAAGSAALILSYQVAARYPVPIGVDTPSHLWRSRVVHALGMPGLFGSSPFEYHANSANPDRIGLPILGSVLSSVVGVGPWRLMFVAAAVGATVLAFAAWALARSIAEPRWAAPIYAAVLATSLPFAITARSHLDNALVDGLLIAAGAIAIRLARGGRGMWAGALVGAGALLMHWPIGLFLVGVLALYSLTLVPGSIAAIKGGTRWNDTPSARLGFVALLSGGLGVGALISTPGAHLFGTSEREPFLRNVHRILPWYRLAHTLPIAGLGTALMWFQRPRSPRRRALLLYLAWMIPVVLGVVLFAAGRPLPVMRLAAVALPIPLLAAAAAAGLIRLAFTPRGVLGGVLATLAVVIVVAAIATQARVARQSLDATQPMVLQDERETIRTAVAYLTSTVPDRKAVFAVQREDDKRVDFGMVRAFRRIRAFAPGRYAPNIATYLGDPDELLAGGPTYRPDIPGFDETSAIYWDLLEPWLTDDTVVMAVRPFYRPYDALLRDHPGTEIAPGVMLLRGPAPGTAFHAPTPLVPPSRGEFARWAASAFAVLFVAGIGWAFALLTLPWADRIAFAPAFGLASLVLVGFVLSSAGVIVSGPPGRWMTAGVAATGWLVGLARLTWNRRRATETVTGGDPNEGSGAVSVVSPGSPVEEPERSP